MRAGVLADLAARSGQVVVTRTLHCAGLGESAVAELVEGAVTVPDGVALAYLAGGAVVRVRLTTAAPSVEQADEVLLPLLQAAAAALGPAVFGRDDDTLAGVVLAGLRAAGRTVAGRRVAHRRDARRRAHRAPGQQRGVPRGRAGLRHRPQGDAGRRPAAAAGRARRGLRGHRRGAGDRGARPARRVVRAGRDRRGRPGAAGGPPGRHGVPGGGGRRRRDQPGGAAAR
jgi:hypothetical protein